MPQQKRFGICIGIQDYSDVGPGNNLRYSAKDAQEVYTTLREYAGFAPENLDLFCDTPHESLKNISRSPSRENILEAVNAVARKANDTDLIFIYFAGHGGEVGGNSYLLTNNTRTDVIRDTSVAVEQLNGYLSSSRASTIVRIFDACRNPVDSLTRALIPGMTRAFENALLKHASGWATFNSCASGEYAFEHPNLEQGVFTYYLCEALRGKASDAGGLVTWDRTVDYVKTSVAAFCNEQGHRQTPHAISDLAGSLELSRKAPEPPGHLDQGQSPRPLVAEIFSRHATDLPAHVRDFQATTREELTSFSELVEIAFKQKVAPISDSYLSIEYGKQGQLQNLNHTAQNLLHKSMGSAGVAGERAGEDYAFEISLNSTHPALPGSLLIVAVIRFTFFYWIWHYHACRKHVTHQSWGPDPAYTTGFIMFKPTAAASELKIHQACDSVIERLCANSDAWAKQSKAKFAERVKPLDKIQNIVS